MLHLWLIKMSIHVGYYIATIGYPLLETYKAFEKKSRDSTWTKVLSYWVIYLLINLLDRMFFFMSGYLPSHDVYSVDGSLTRSSRPCSSSG